MDEMKNKLVIYTALFGDYDELIDPKKNYQGCDFICFTDQKNLKSDIWQIKIVDKIDLPPNMMNRKYKILPHLYLKEYEWSMYIDSNIAILANPYELASRYLSNHDFVVPQHFARDCIYQEAVECISLGKANSSEVLNQISFYKDQGFPEKFGLGENGILLRCHNKDNVIKIMDDWWCELTSRTKRDQLSLGYILWKNERHFKFMKENARGNKYFKIKLHSSERKIGVKGLLLNSVYEYLGNNPNGKLTSLVVRINKFLKSLHLK